MFDKNKSYFLVSVAHCYLEGCRAEVFFGRANAVGTNAVIE
jgi:hypothetical protein